MINFITTQGIEHSSDTIMDLLKRRRDVISWEYDTYCNDHVMLYGTRPMSFSKYMFYRGDDLLRKQEVADYVSEKLIRIYTVN